MRSAQVALDGAFVSLGGVVGVAAGLAQRAALAVQVPEAVELDVDPFELDAKRRDGLGLLGQLAFTKTQLPLAVLESLDLGLDLLLVHAPMVRHVAPTDSRVARSTRRAAAGARAGSRCCCSRSPRRSCRAGRRGG